MKVDKDMVKDTVADTNMDTDMDMGIQGSVVSESHISKNFSLVSNIMSDFIIVLSDLGVSNVRLT